MSQRHTIGARVNRETLDILDIHLNVWVDLDVSTHGLIVAELQKADLGEGEVGAEDADDPVRHPGEHQRQLDGEGRQPGQATALFPHSHCSQYSQTRDSRLTNETIVAQNELKEATNTAHNTSMFHVKNEYKRHMYICKL